VKYRVQITRRYEYDCDSEEAAVMRALWMEEHGVWLSDEKPHDVQVEALYCLVEPVGGKLGDLTLCDQYPACPCGGPESDPPSEAERV
jgi:hypothetical protein